MNQFPQQQDNRSLYAIIGLLICVVIIAGLLFYFYGDQVTDFLKGKNETANLIEYEIKVYDALQNKEISADYVIYQDTIQRQVGITKEGILEKFNYGVNLTNYSIEATSTDYYWNRSMCENKLCKVTLMPIADYYFIYVLFDEYILFIKPLNGTLYNPMICGSWDGSLKIIRLVGLNSTTIPSIYLNNFDVCWKLYDGYLKDMVQYNLKYEWDEFIQRENSTIKLKLIDTCVSNRENIFEGCAEDKEIEIMVI